MTNNNTSNNKIFGETIMVDFNNGIFHTVADETKEGVFWIIETATGKMITFARCEEDVLFAVGELMKTRIAGLKK
jgi:hypothetical protein